MAAAGPPTPADEGHGQHHALSYPMGAHWCHRVTTERTISEEPVYPLNRRWRASSRRSHLVSTSASQLAASPRPDPATR